MSRHTGEARITLNGDRALAARYVSEGRKYLGGLMVTHPQMTAVRELTNPDGVHFRVGYFAGVPFIQITATSGSSGARARFAQGFMLAPRASSLYQYSDQPFTLLVPGNGPIWSSVFKSVPDELTGSTHPTSAFTDAAGAYGKVFGEAPAGNFAIARPTALNNAHQYWANKDRTLFVQYDGVPYCGGGRPSSGNRIIVNGQTVVEPAQLVSMVQSAYPGFTSINLLGAAARRTGSGLRMMMAVQAALDIYATDLRIAVLEFDIKAASSEVSRIGAMGLDGSYAAYAAVFAPAVADETTVSLLAEHGFTSLQTQTAHSSFAFSPDLTEGRTFLWPKNAGVTQIHSLLFTIPESGDPAFTVESISAMPSATSTDTSTYGAYTAAFASWSPDLVNLVPVGGSARTLSRPSVGKFRCMVDYSSDGFPVYGYAKFANRLLTDDKSMTFDNGISYFYELGSPVARSDSYVYSTHLYEYDDQNNQLAFEFPNYNEAGEEQIDTWLDVTATVVHQQLTDSGTWNWRIKRDARFDPAYIHEFVRNQTTVSSNENIISLFSYLDLKTKSAIVTTQKDLTVTTTAREWTPSPDLFPAFAGDTQIPQYPTTTTSNNITRQFRKACIVNGITVYDSGFTNLRVFASAGSPSVGSIIAPVDYYAFSWHTNNVIFTRPPDSTNVSSSEMQAPSNNQVSSFALNLERDWLAVVNDKFAITGVTPYPTNLSSGAVAYLPLSVTNFGINAASKVDYMLGAHGATRFTPPMYISKHIVSSIKG